QVGVSMLEPLSYKILIDYGLTPKPEDRVALPILGANTVGLVGSPMGQGPLLAASALVPEKTGPIPIWVQEMFARLAINTAFRIVVFAIVFGIAVRLIEAVVDSFANYLKSRVNDGITLAFQADLFNHLQRLSFSYHDQTSVGDSLYRLHNDT